MDSCEALLMDLEIRLADGSADTYPTTNNRKNVGTFFELYYEAEVTADKALEVFELEQKYAYRDSDHFPQPPERRRRVAYYPPDQWISYRGVVGTLTD